MKSKLTAILILCSLFSFAQLPLSSYNTKEVFGDRGEIYFVLKGAANDANRLSKIISIDNVKDGDLYAYANIKEFEMLRNSFDYDFFQLTKPSELSIQPMSDITREVLDWNYYPTYTAYLQIMQDFATNFPSICKIDTIGSTNDGRLILVARISDNVGVEEDEPEFLYTSSIHGDETTGYILTLHLIDYLLTNYNIDDRVTNLINNIDIWINPLANPDGTYAGGNNSVNGATRYNANYVDLNRNYPDPDDGPHPDGNSWQMETVAFMNFAESRNFVISANFHGGAEVANYPWDTWSKLTADDDWWEQVAREYADTVHSYGPSNYFRDLNNGVTNGYAWYTITGGRQDYMNYFQQCREITYEISSTKLLPANQLLNFWNYNYHSMLNYMEEVQYGVRGVITDTITKEPLEAQVFISNHDIDSSMVFSCFPMGNYHRLLKAGTYNITYFAEGYLPKTRKNVVITDKATVTQNVQLWDGSPIPAFSSSDTIANTHDTIQFFDNSGGSPSTRLWTFEGGTPATSTEANPMIIYSTAGNYDVTLYVANMIGNNTLTVDNYITIKSGVGVPTQEATSLTCYPNPAGSQGVFIESSTALLRYELTDMLGKDIILEQVNSNKINVPTSSLRNGIYLLKVLNTTGNKTFKIIVNN